MTFPLSPASISASQINTELGLSSTHELSLSWLSSLTKSDLNIVESGNTNGTSRSYNFTVPAFCTKIYATLIGGGGGGGSNSTNGGIVGGSGGGSGGYISAQEIAVTPGEVLTVGIGYGGYGGDYRFNSNYSYFNTVYSARTGNLNPGTYNGGSGGDSYIRRGGTDLARATGGSGGLVNGSGGGIGGTPNGLNGTGSYDTGNCTTIINGATYHFYNSYDSYARPLGGNMSNGSSYYGFGGNGGQCRVGFPGEVGAVYISSTGGSPISVNRYRSTGTGSQQVSYFKKNNGGACNNGNCTACYDCGDCGTPSYNPVYFDCYLVPYNCVNCDGQSVIQNDCNCYSGTDYNCDKFMWSQDCYDCG